MSIPTLTSKYSRFNFITPQGIARGYNFRCAHHLRDGNSRVLDLTTSEPLGILRPN